MQTFAHVSQAAFAEAAKLKKQLAASTEEAAVHKALAESVQKQLESANSKTLAARQAAAGLDMDLAAAHDRLACETALAASALVAAESRHRSLQDQLDDINKRHSKQVCDEGLPVKILKTKAVSLSQLPGSEPNDFTSDQALGNAGCTSKVSTCKVA